MNMGGTKTPYRYHLLPESALLKGGWAALQAGESVICHWSRWVLLSAMATLFVACQQVPLGQVSAESKMTFVEFHLQEAQNHIDSGHYFQALKHIDLLLLVDPDNERYEADRQSVIKLASFTKQELLQHSQQARKNNQTDKYHQLLLQALSLQPDDEEIIAELSLLTSEQLRQEQLRKQADYASLHKQVEPQPLNPMQISAASLPAAPKSDPIAEYRSLFSQGQYQALIDKFANSHPVEVPVELEGWLMESHLTLAIELQQQQQTESALAHAEKAVAYSFDDEANDKLRAMQKQFSLTLFENGRSLIRNDIDKAIKFLDLASQFDNQNSLISDELSKALRIRNNLTVIKTLN